MTEELAAWLEPLWQRFLDTAGEDRLGHALLIAGEPGLGKRKLVQRMVAWLLDPVGWADPDSRSNRWLANGAHPDHFVLQPEEDSRFIRIHQIRQLAEQLQLTAQTGPRRVAVIDPAQAMNRESQNGLLKTLEEPPAGVHLLLVTDAPGALLPTVRSRCQSWSVVAPDQATAQAWLHSHGGPVDKVSLALAAGHPGIAQALASPEHGRRRSIVADDLSALAAGRQNPVDVAGRWASDAAGHLDDAILLLRAWAWQSQGADMGDLPRSPLPASRLAEASGQVLTLRRRLDLPLRASWLLHEWLLAWQLAGAQSHRP